MSQTIIFNSFSDFLARTDKRVNGVSAEFAEITENYLQQNKSNEGCWNCSSCRDCRNCSSCSDCSYCSSCSGCSYCSDCSGCRNCRYKAGDLIVPKIDNIHNAVFQAVSNKGISMNDWHSECGTTHCRAGWVVALSGDAGKELEKQTSTPFAAMCIYNTSSKIKVQLSQFFVSNELAMADIERCAKEELVAKNSDR